MPSLFSRLKNRDGKKSKKGVDDGAGALPEKQRWEDAFTRTSVEPEEIQELIRRCTEEIKARALDHPFFILSYRPTSNPSAVRTFIRHFFDPDHNMGGDRLVGELRMVEPMVIVGVVKWCWARLPGGVVGWDTYELFKVGEQDSRFARDAFKTFIPLSVEGAARSSIVFDFFDLLSAVAAHSKTNGLGGRKLSRMAGWWAFEHKPSSGGFDPAYSYWLKTADATGHLFFAYLRSLSPDENRAAISMLPMSLQKLLHETEYPPKRPGLMQMRTSRVVMVVDAVSPTPFSLLRRANHFEYRDDDRALYEYSNYDDPIEALTEECKRVLKAISAANQSGQASSSKHSTGLRDASWSRFEDLGFSGPLEEDPERDDPDGGPRSLSALRSAPASKLDLGRPTTPSWADFLSSGFTKDDGRVSGPSSTLLPPDKVLPQIDTARQRSAQSHHPATAADPESDQQLEPGELASIIKFDLDDVFWWVWMSSLAPEETSERKSAFGRCAVIEVNLQNGRWLVMEEVVVGAAPEVQEGAYIAEKKGFFSWRRTKGLGRRKSTSGKQTLAKAAGGEHQQPDHHMAGRGGGGDNFSKTSIGPDQHARIQAAAAQLQARHMQEKVALAQARPQRRGRSDQEVMHEKTNSVLTLQPVIAEEATSALKWARNYDKEAFREAYLSNNEAGRGRGLLPLTPTQEHGFGRNGYVDGERRQQQQQQQQAVDMSGPEANSALAGQPPTPVTPASPMFFSPHEREELPQVPAKDVSPPPPPASRHDSWPAPAAGRSTTPLPPDLEPAPVRESTTTPEPQNLGKRGKLRKEHKEPRGLMKLFSRSKRSSKVPENAAADINDMMRQDGETPEPPSQQPPTELPAGPQEHEQEQEQEPEQDQDQEHHHQYPQHPTEQPPPLPPNGEEEESPMAGPGRAEHGLVVPLARDHSYETAVEDNLSPPDSGDAREAHAEFSRFDQGPLMDQPVYAPAEVDDDMDEGEYFDDDAAPPPIFRAKGEPVETIPEESAESPEDRWAKLRRTAAARQQQAAAAARNSEEGHGGYSRSTDDGEDETSAEETIEARVARIKARVAELTSSMEGSGNGAPPPQRRQMGVVRE